MIALLRKHLLFLAALCLIAVVPLYAQELQLGPSDAESAKAEADAFYSRCVKDPIFNLSDETNLAFCACSSSHMQEWLQRPAKTQTGKEFYQPAEEKKLERHNLITEVYGPCLYIPIYDLSREDCMADEGNNYFTRPGVYLDILCDCMASGDEEYFGKYAQPYLKMKVAMGENIYDPIKAVKRDSAYYSFNYNLENQCFIKNRALP